MKKIIKIIFIISTIFHFIGCEDFDYELNSDKTGYILKKYKGSSEYITIPDTHKGLPITEIGDHAFSKKKNITGDLIIPETITKIGESAFARTSFMKVILPKNLKIIDSWAFEKCEDLTNITFHDGIEEINEGAFYGCEKLTGHLIIPKNLTKINEGAFRGTGYTSLTIPNNIKVIEKYAFSGSRLTGHIIIPDSVVEIADRAFINIDAKKITISKNIKKIGDWTFADCKELREVIIPEGVTEIGDSAFDSCLLLESVIISSTVTSIGEKAFGDYCRSLTNIICNAQNPPIITATTFLDSPIESIKVPKESIVAYQKADGWKKFASIITSQ